MKQFYLLIALALLLTPLAMANDFVALCSTGSLESITAAIATGANVNATNEHGKTPLMAVVCREPKLLTVLIKTGADVNARDNEGWTPLMYATLGFYLVEHVNILLDAKAKPGETNNLGQTAVQLAAQHNSNPVIVLRLASATLGITTNELMATRPVNAPSKEARDLFDSGLWFARHETAENYRQALDRLARAHTLSPNSDWPELHYNLGLLYQKLNRHKEARGSFAQYLTQAPQASDATSVSDQIARLDVALEKERRRLQLQGAWNCGGGLWCPAINLYVDGATTTAGVFVQNEMFRGIHGDHARWGRVPASIDGGQLTLRFEQKMLRPATGYEGRLFYRSHHYYFGVRQVTPRTLEGVYVWCGAPPSRIVLHKVSDTPAENLANVGKHSPDIPWTDERLSRGRTREVKARNYLIEGNTAVETADTPADYEMALLYFQNASSWLRDWPSPHYNLALTAEMLGTKAHYTNALAHLDQYLALPVTTQEKDDAQAIRARIAEKLAKLSDLQTLAGIWVPKISNSSHDEPRLEISKSRKGVLQARALGGKSMEQMVPISPWVPVVADSDCRIENARYYTQHKSAAADCGPFNVTFNLTRIAEDQLEGTVSMTYVGSDSRRRANNVTRTYVFERDTPAIPTQATPADQRRLLRR